MYDRFYKFNISDEILTALAEMGFEEPTQIQKIAIPPVLEGLDIIGVAQTGTGKTAAFGIPMIERNIKGKSKSPCSLVLVPTRELCIQVAQEMNKMGKYKGFNTIPIYGGQSIERQIKSLKRDIDLVVGTPGRVIDHIKRKTLVLNSVSMVVLDEADEMLNMGFIEDIQTILGETPEERQTMLFSATMPDQIVRISKQYMRSPKRVSVDTKDMVVAKIKQVFYEVRENDKAKALTRILDVQDPSLTLIFCHTRRDVDELAGKLQQMGYEAGAIHGEFTQAHRDEMMHKFKNGDIDILVATDVAARGLDINDVSHVINYSIPQNPDAYIHRIGRTGRAGKSGIAITFVTPRENRQLRLIEKTARTKIDKGVLPTRKEVIIARERDIFEEMEEVISEGKYTDYKALVTNLLNIHTVEDVASAALFLLYGDHEVEHIDEIESIKTTSRTEMRKLLLSIGKKDQIKVGDIVRTVSERLGIPGRNIGKIVVFDKYSLVEVPITIAEQVIGSINDLIIDGKKVRIEEDKKKTSSRNDRVNKGDRPKMERKKTRKYTD
ncbi:MAG: DEAD/DEAH box helicase [Nitrospirae bacterium]|nr:DEAD/DEAH box helicase [Nitrospirota bacterium]